MPRVCNDLRPIAPGDRFGRWTALSPLASRRSGTGMVAVWLCRCRCEREKPVAAWRLRGGHTDSCGCRCRKHPPIKPGRRFGLYVVVEKSVRRGRWLCRCDCGTRREVTQSSLNAKRPPQSCGCRVAVTTGKLYTHGGESLSLQAWAKRLMVHPNTIRRRLLDGWPPGRALTAAKVAAKPYRLAYGGQVLTLTEWSRRTGVPYTTLLFRLRRGDSPAQVLGIEAKERVSS